jgi:hypothetical protein
MNPLTLDEAEVIGGLGWKVRGIWRWFDFGRPR